jgi:nucleotide-binding universal stress UspA family protein
MMAGLSALVPLDGTELSESALSLLPFLKSLGFDRLRLVSVWESDWEESEAGGRHQELSEADERGRSYLTSYLAQRAETVRAGGFDVEEDVRMGRAAPEVLAAAEGLDLILIATHGRTGVSRWWLGSVTDQVVREADCPVLVIGPNVTHDLAFYSLRRVLLPLDGSETAELALPPAAWIASRSGAEVDLVRCMTLTGVAYDPGMAVYSGDLIDAMQDAVSTYLDEAAAKLAGLSVHKDVLIGGPGQLLLDYLEKRQAQLVIMTSHGRTGITRAALGSVTDRMLHGPAPVLVLRTGEDQHSRLVEAARKT